MSMVRRAVTAAITSPALRDAARRQRRLMRGLAGGGKVIEFFCQIDDPYGPIALAFLPSLAARHQSVVRYHLVPAPDEAAAPEAGRLAAYAVRDSQRLAEALGLDRIEAATPDPARVNRAQAIAAAALRIDDPAPALIAITGALLAGAPLDDLASRYGEDGASDTAAALERGRARREACGHYLGSVTAFEGETYWGVDRLHYLEARLRGEDGEHGAPICPVLDIAGLPASMAAGSGPTIDFYLSFRSPYTMVAAERIGALADAYGARLRLRPVLPMVMRGLPVPRAKQLYIMRDTKREAMRHGIAFGSIVDPVGAGVERGLAVLHHADAEGKGLAFAQSFLRGAWAEATDMTTDAGLMRVAERAGIDAASVRTALADDRWRAVCEANRAAMFALGIWGVPSFQVDDRPAWWGQDRLWMIEDDLRQAMGLPAIDRRRA